MPSSLMVSTIVLFGQVSATQACLAPECLAIFCILSCAM